LNQSRNTSQNTTDFPVYFLVKAQKCSNHYQAVILNRQKSAFLLDRKASDVIKLNYKNQPVSGNLVACVGFSLLARASVLGQELEAKPVNHNNMLVGT
jgi:hypothetical protein